MADILIRGMELPKSGGILCINIFPDGKVTRQLDLSCEQIATAVPLPEKHGWLIDADALKKRTPMVIDYSAGGFGTDGSIRPVRGYGDWQIDQAPTIIPAEGGPDNGD